MAGFGEICPKSPKLKFWIFRHLTKQKCKKTPKGFMFKIEICLIMCRNALKHARNLGKMKHFVDFYEFFYTDMAEKSS